MKKIIAITSALAITLSGTVTPVQAENTKVVAQSNEEETFLNLTLDKVLEEAIENDSNLTLLWFQYRMLDLQDEITEETIDGIEDSLSSMPPPPETNPEVLYAQFLASYLQKSEEYDLESEVPLEDLELLQNQALVQAQINMLTAGQSSNTQLREQRYQLEESLDQLSTEQTKNFLQHQEAEEGIRLMMVGRYIELVSLQESLEFREAALEMTKRDLQKAEVFYRLGLSSNEEVTNISEEIEKQEREIDSTKKQYDLQVKKLVMDLNLDIDKKVIFEDLPSTELKLVTQEIETEELISDSYQMRRLKQDYYLLDDKSTSGLSRLEKRLRNVEIDMLQEQIQQKEKQLEQSIMNLYHEVEKSYDSMKEQERLLKIEQQNYNNLKIRHEVGLISNFDLEQAYFLIIQALFNLKTAENSYYMLTKQVEALENGYIN